MNLLSSKKILNLFLLSSIFLTLSTKAEAAWTISNGRLVDSNSVATMSVNEHFNLGVSSLQNSNWREAVTNFNIVSKCFPLSEQAKDANYYMGIALFNLQEFDFANKAFSDYIGAKSHPKYFIEAIEYKFCIAEAFRKGAYIHMFGKKQLPKWASGQELGITIYDEVVAALPTHDFAAKALYSKGCMLFEMNDCRASIDALQLMIKRFPKHELAPESYLMITKIYLHQCKSEFQNPDLLAFAEINTRRFKEQFSRDERVVESENIVQGIKESYAKGLYDTAQFYERTEQIKASAIYYQTAILQFPDTDIAKLCQLRLDYLNTHCRAKGPTP